MAKMPSLILAHSTLQERERGREREVGTGKITKFLCSDKYVIRTVFHDNFLAMYSEYLVFQNAINSPEIANKLSYMQCTS